MVIFIIIIFTLNTIAALIRISHNKSALLTKYMDFPDINAYSLLEKLTSAALVFKIKIIISCSIITTFICLNILIIYRFFIENKRPMDTVLYQKHKTPSNG